MLNNQVTQISLLSSSLCRPRRELQQPAECQASVQTPLPYGLFVCVLCFEREVLHDYCYRTYKHMLCCDKAVPVFLLNCRNLCSSSGNKLENAEKNANEAQKQRAEVS